MYLLFAGVTSPFLARELKVFGWWKGTGLQGQNKSSQRIESSMLLSGHKREEKPTGVKARRNALPQCIEMGPSKKHGW